MFSGSIPSLQYQDSSKGILLQNSQQNHLSPAQAFLNQHMSRNTIGNASQEPAQPRDSGLLPPILQNSKNPVARLQHHPRGQDSREHLKIEQQQSSPQVSFKITPEETFGADSRQYAVVQKVHSKSSRLGLPAARIRGGKNSHQSNNPLEGLLPSSEIIEEELMNNFGGKELSVRHDIDSRTSPMLAKPSRNQLKQIENQSCMSTANPEVNVKYSAKSDKTMRETLEKYKQIMDSGEVTKENLYLKKIRFSHPLFR